MSTSDAKLTSGEAERCGNRHVEQEERKRAPRERTEIGEAPELHDAGCELAGSGGPCGQWAAQEEGHSTGGRTYDQANKNAIGEARIGLGHRSTR